KRAYCLKTQPATGETYPKSDLFNKAPPNTSQKVPKHSAANFLNITTSIKLFTRTSGPCRSLFIVIRDDDKNKAALF
ncbi:hypothetical protein, partial [Klebsiella pneumoniae]